MGTFGDLYDDDIANLLREARASKDRIADLKRQVEEIVGEATDATGTVRVSWISDGIADVEIGPAGEGMDREALAEAVKEAVAGAREDFRRQARDLAADAFAASHHDRDAMRARLEEVRDVVDRRVGDVLSELERALRRRSGR